MMTFAGVMEYAGHGRVNKTEIAEAGQVYETTAVLFFVIQGRFKKQKDKCCLFCFYCID
jgi:hypothetical protein